MKKVLLSTTALVAAGLLVTSVAYAGDEEMAEEEMMEEEMAAEPISVGISGTALAALSVSSEDGSPTMWQHFEPVISGSATMDNGLTFGVSMVVDIGSTWFPSGIAYDRHISVGGAFGDIELGRRKSARSQMKIGSAGATTNFGVNGPYWGGVAKTVDTSGGRADTIVYKSPSVGGIQLGLSYAPDDGNVSDRASAAVTFTQDLGDASVSVNVGYETGSAAAVAAVAAVPADLPWHEAEDAVPAVPARSPSDLNAGASISVGDVTLSGGMKDSDDGNGGGDMLMDIGASVAMGSLTLSAGWASSDTSDMFALAAAYPLGEGVQLGMQVDFGEQPMSDADPDGEWVQFMIGTAVSF
jgi:hypothetical protein